MYTDRGWHPSAGRINLIRGCRSRGFSRFAAGLVSVVVGIFGATLLAAGCNHPAAVVSGMAVAFDGTSGVVSIPLVTSAAGNVTLESWVKIPTDAKGCFVKIGDANTGYGIGVGSIRTNFDAGNAGNALIGLYENAQWVYPIGNPTLSTDAWHHVAFVIGTPETAPTFYIDGTPYVASLSGPTNAPVDSAAIGKDLVGDRSTNATLAKVAVYNSALSAAKITAHATATSDASYDAAVLADSPVAYYELNEESGPSAVDRSGNSNTGTYGGKIMFLRPGPFASKQPPQQ